MAGVKEFPKFPIRWTPDIRDAVKGRAARNRRSINAEILAILEDGLGRAPATPVQLELGEGEAA